MTDTASIAPAAAAAPESAAPPTEPALIPLKSSVEIYALCALMREEVAELIPYFRDNLSPTAARQKAEEIVRQRHYNAAWVERQAGRQAEAEALLDRWAAVGI